MKLIIWDFSRTLLFPKAGDYIGGLNKLYDVKKSLGFNELFITNDELIDYIDKIKSKVKSIIFTTGNIQNAPEIAEKLEGKFAGIENVISVGYPKDNPKSFNRLCIKYDADPQNVLFIDDSQKNLIAAQEAGLKTLQYTSNKEVMEEITKWIS